MALPNNANRIVVQGFWWDEATGGGNTSTLKFEPIPLSGSSAPNLTDPTAYGWIKARSFTVTPDSSTGYYAVALLANDDPDLDAFGGWQVTPQGETPFQITVTATAATATATTAMAAKVTGLTVGSQVQAIWLTEAAVVTTNPPTPPSSYLTATQTSSVIATALSAHNSDGAAHPDIRALIGSSGGGSGGAVSSVAGRTGDVTLTKSDVGLNNVNNTADANKPTSSATQTALDAKADSSAFTSHTGNTSNPHGVTKSQVALGNVANTAPADLPVSTAQQTALDAKAARTANLSDLASATTARTNLGLGALATTSPTGTASATTYLRGDNVWATPSGSGGVSNYKDLSGLPVFPILSQGATTGSTDNATAIAAAISAASTAGGGVVEIPAGAFVSGPFSLPSRVFLRGVGPSSVLKLKNNVNTHFITLASVNVDQVGIVDLTLDGNKANQTDGDVLHFDTTAYDNGRAFPSLGDPQHYVHNLVVINGKRHGVFTTGDYSAALFSWVHSYSNDVNNFYINSPDNNFVSCVSAGSGLEGFLVGGNSERLINCKSFVSGRLDSTHGDGFKVAYIARTDLIGCEAQDNRRHGFYLSNTNQVQLVGRADRNGLGPSAAGGNGDGLYAENLLNSRIDLVTGDRAAGADGNNGGSVTVMQRYGYSCGAGNNNNQVTITAGLNATGYGTGSWGANSLVTITAAGAFISPAPPTPITVQTAAYTLALADAGAEVDINSSVAVTVTVPTNAAAAFPVGTTIDLAQAGAGQVTVAGAAGVTVNSRGGALKLAGQYGHAALRKTATNVWRLVGDVTT